MPEIPLIQPGSSLVNTGNRTAQTARLTAGSESQAWGQALSGLGQQVAEITAQRQRANDNRALMDLSTQMDRMRDEQKLYQQEDLNQENWGDAWEKRTAKFQETLDNTSLSDDARFTAAQAFQRLSQEGTIQVQMMANQQANNRAETSVLTRMQAAKTPEAVDELRTFWPGLTEDFDARAAIAKERIYNESADNRYKAAIIEGDEKALDASLAYGKEVAGWDEDTIKVRRLAGMDGVQQTKRVNQSRSEAEFLGDVMMRKAKGEVIAPEQIETWVKENKVDKDTGARLLVAVKSEQGALQSDFYDFLNTKVDSYDSTEDPDGTKAYELQKEAALLGLNQHQISFFQHRLERAGKLSGPQRTQQAVLTAGKKVIGTMLKDMGQTRSWDSDAETLFKDPAKLEAFGIPADQAKEIERLTKGTFTWLGKPTGEGVDRSKALKIFRDHAVTRASVKPAGLSDAEWNKMISLSEGDESVDPNAEISREFDRAILEESLENWYNYELNKNKVPPTEKEVQNWVGEKTRAVIQGSSAGNIFQLSEPTASTGTGAESQRYTRLADGGYEGIASSYGYDNDDDNGYNSLGMLRGKQPWYGQMPTVALAPGMAKEFGVSLPRQKKDGWDWSKSIVELEAPGTGKKVKAIYDENGMYIVAASKNKLVDLTPEASAALGLPTKTNAKVIVRKPQA